MKPSIRLSLAIIHILSFCAVGYAQLSNSYGSVYNVVAPLWNNPVGAEYYGAGKSGIARVGMLGTALVNPAGLSSSGLTFELGTFWKSAAAEIADFEYQQATHFPSLLTLSIPLDPYCVQVGVIRSYDSKSLSSEFPITTVDHPDGTGQFTRSITTGMIHTAFVSASTTPLPSLSLGITAGVDIIFIHNSLMSSFQDLNGTRLRFIGGLLYELIPQVSFGAAFRYTLPASLQYSTERPLLLMNGSPYTLKAVARTPFEFEVGASIQPLQGWFIMTSAQYENWTRAISRSLDRWQFHAGIDIAALHTLRLQAGYFTQYAPAMTTRAYYDQQFITFGISMVLFDPLKIALSYISSEPFSDENPLFSTYISRPKNSFYRSQLNCDLSFGL